MVNIVSRSQWGAKPWRSTTSRPLSRVTGYYVHYHGGPPPASTGNWVPRNIEAIHLGNGWSGVGYHFVVDQAGTIYEGRGWDLVGAHSPPHNTDGLGVYVAIGGDQKPTEAAKRSVRALYDEACRRTGKALYKRWHGYDYATACPGPHLIAWVKGGMKVDGSSSNTGGTQSIKPKPVTKPAPKYYQPSGVEMSVKQIQSAAGVKADGYYGNDTKAAVKRLQKKLGVAADGLWGPATEAAYSKPKGGSPKAPSSRLAVDGIKGKATIRALQKHLGVTADGIQGKNTNKALQRWLGVAADGIVGKRTVTALQRKVGASADGIWGTGTTKALQRYLNKH